LLGFTSFGLLDFPGFARHQIALKCNSMRGVYERQTVYSGKPLVS
jgi:hypothetical protein